MGDKLEVSDIVSNAYQMFEEGFVSKLIEELLSPGAIYFTIEQ